MVSDEPQRREHKAKAVSHEPERRELVRRGLEELLAVLEAHLRPCYL